MIVCCSGKRNKTKFFKNVKNVSNSSGARSHKFTLPGRMTSHIQQILSNSVHSSQFILTHLKMYWPLRALIRSVLIFRERFDQ